MENLFFLFLVLQESKSNAPLNVPPLHPISKLGLLNIPKNTSSLDNSIKISENPDSAVITPIPKKVVDLGLPEKRRKTISNILRAPGDKKMRKQDLKFNQDSASMDSGSTYNSDNEMDRDKKKDSDDEVTLIKVVNSDSKKSSRRSSLVDDLKIDVKSLKQNLLENAEASEKDDVKSHENTKSDFDTNRIIVWNDGVGSLPGSSIKVIFLKIYANILDQKI